MKKEEIDKILKSYELVADEIIETEHNLNKKLKSENKENKIIKYRKITIMEKIKKIVRKLFKSI